LAGRLGFKKSFNKKPAQRWRNSWKKNNSAGFIIAPQNRYTFATCIGAFT
jgi:hypothetical protein